MVEYRIDEYEAEILPFIEKSGIPVATYIKKAIEEKIAKDGKTDNPPNQ